MSELIDKLLFLFGLLVVILQTQTCGNTIHKKQVLNNNGIERSIFNYHHNGIKVNVKAIPLMNKTSHLSRIEEDGFPQFPLHEISLCLIDLSLPCIQKKITNFLNIVRHLQKITLFGEYVKLIRLKDLPIDRQANPRILIENIDSSIDNFFETFALRITLPEWNGNKNQIDVMMDDVDNTEARGGKGGSKGGKGGKGGKGTGCKKMMMMMVVGLKMKMMGMIGMAAMKGMLMSGMSLMISKMMILHQLMNKKGGIFGGFNGGNSNNGQLKEIVLLTKTGDSGGGTGGCGGGNVCGTSSGTFLQDNYGTPPLNGGSSGSYDYSGGNSGSGVGWGRNFNEQPSLFWNDYIFQHHSEPIIKVPFKASYKYMPTKDSTNNNHNYILNYTTQQKPSKKIKVSQDKKKIYTKNYQFNNENEIRPMYAAQWKNYEIARYLKTR